MKKTTTPQPQPKIASLPARQETSAPAVQTNVRLTRSTAPRKGSSIVFLIPGVRGTVKIARSAFSGEPPALLEVVGSPFAPASVPKAKMTKEERAAERA